MKTNLWLVILAAAALAGCATPFRAPPDVAHIKLDRADSSVVVVEKIWLERKNGPLVVVFTERKLDWHGGKLYATESMARLIARWPLSLQKLSRVTLV